MKERIVLFLCLIGVSACSGKDLDIEYRAGDIAINEKTEDTEDRKSPRSSGNNGDENLAESEFEESVEGSTSKEDALNPSFFQDIGQEQGQICAMSADCTAGTHCDLGECVQSCDESNPCEKGSQCSARGRCLQEEEEDLDPPVVTEKVGSLSAEPRMIRLTEDDEKLRIRLRSDSDEVVRYRVVCNAPHLRALEPRGEFIEDTVIELAVDTDSLAGLDVPGTVTVVTNLGSLTIDAPIQVGMTGAYEGALRYFVGDVPLGNARIALEIHEDNGDLSVRVDTKQSLLFPMKDNTAVFGKGIFTFSEGAEFTVTHILESRYGHKRNHFERSIGREISFKMQPNEGGILEGTFEERIFGLFEQPIVLNGTVSLRSRITRHSPDFVSPQKLDMPEADARAGIPLDAFESKTPRTSIVALAGEACTESSCKVVACANQSNLNNGLAIGCLKNADTFYYAGLKRSFANTRNDSDPLGRLRDDCQKEMLMPVVDFVGIPSSLRRCAHPLGFAAILAELATTHDPNTRDAATVFHRSVARLLSAPLLVAQDSIVKGVSDSFLLGSQSQQTLYEEAQDLLDRPASFLMQAPLLEFMRRTPMTHASGIESDDPTERDYPGFRALSRLFYVMSVLNGELANLSGNDPNLSREEVSSAAQENALLTLLEAAVLAAITDSWGAVPAGMGTELVGILTPMDRGFGTLLQGAVVFGVPEGEIPLAFDSSRALPTNFEQVLELRARPAIEQQASREAAFLSSLHDFEQNEATLERELEGVRNGQEEIIASICGSSFDVEAVQSEEDWDLCGAHETGLIAEALGDIDQRHAELLSAQTRLEGMGQKIKIDEQALRRTQAARGKTLSFISRSGSELVAIVEITNVIESAQVALELASNSSLWNLGASAVAGAASAMLEVSKGQYQVRRQELETAQTMRFSEQGQEIELIDGMANIKKQLIDLHQLEVDMHLSSLAITHTEIALINHIERAKRAHMERARTLARIEKSPYSDPLYRLLMNRSALQALEARRASQRWLYRAGRALEYEINTPLGNSLNHAILAAYNKAEMKSLQDCLGTIFSDYAVGFGVPQEFSTTISVRDMLGIHGPRVDSVTGEELSEGELFRRLLLRNENLDGKGGVAIEFSTNLEPGNGLWSSNVCNDKVVSVQAQIMGDFQGDNEAEVHLSVRGGGVMRPCNNEGLVTWSIDSPDLAVVQAGVNGNSDTRENTTLYGHSVARPSWRVTIPGGESAPANLDLNLAHVEDIVLKIKHKALPLNEFSTSVSLECLAAIGAGT